MKNIIGIKNDDNVALYEVSNCVSNSVLQSITVPAFVIKDDIILATEDLNTFGTALCTIADGMDNNIILTKEYIVMNIVPLIIKMCNIFGVNYHPNNRKYLCLDGGILLAQKDKLFYIDIFLNVFEIMDYVSIGKASNIYKLELYNALPQDYESTIISTTNLLPNAILGFPAKIRRITTKDLKEEIINASN